MIGSVPQKPGHRLGHDDPADTFGVNLVPIRGTLREAQAEARSSLHRRRGARSAKFSVADCEHSYRIHEAVETLARPWAAENLEQIPVDVLIFYWASLSQPSLASMMSVGASSWRATSSGPGHMLKP
jgi:DNA-binding GntR family transcriptional regulator